MARRCRVLGVPFQPVDYFAVLKKCGETCYYCGRTVKANLQENVPEQLTIDHMQPLSLGGKHDLENCVVACRACNDAKGIMTAGEFLEVLGKNS